MIVRATIQNKCTAKKISLFYTVLGVWNLWPSWNSNATQERNWEKDKNYSHAYKYIIKPFVPPQYHEKKASDYRVLWWYNITYVRSHKSSVIVFKPSTFPQNPIAIYLIFRHSTFLPSMCFGTFLASNTERTFKGQLLFWHCSGGITDGCGGLVLGTKSAWRFLSTCRSADCTYVEDVGFANISARHAHVSGSRHMSLLSLLWYPMISWVQT